MGSERSDTGGLLSTKQQFYGFETRHLIFAQPFPGPLASLYFLVPALFRRTAGLLTLHLPLENICNWQIVRQGRAGGCEGRVFMQPRREERSGGEGEQRVR